MDFNIINIISLCSSIIIVILAVISLIIIRRFHKKIEDRNAEQGPHLSLQRELLENKVYNANELLTKEEAFFSDTSHILIDASKSDMTIKHQVPDYSYFSDMGIELPSIIVDDTLIACLMPFNNKFNKLYENIKHVCETQQYNCKRSDEEYIESNSNLRKYIVELILKAKVVIAVLDGRNPNVFYEIGIAHSMGKLVLLLANVNHTSDVPVDFQANRLIIYNDMRELRDKLSKTLEAVHYD